MSGYFTGVDMEGLRRHQVKFLSAAVGGPQAYNGRDLTAAHAGLKITDQDFNRMLGHLNATLVEVGADDGTIRSVLKAVSALQDQIVES
jgi:hemoglobin